MKHEEQLRQARDDLEIRVRVRTAELAAANEELQQERYLLHTLMDYLPHNIYFKDAASRFVRVNQAWPGTSGCRRPAEASARPTWISSAMSMRCRPWPTSRRSCARAGRSSTRRKRKRGRTATSLGSARRKCR